MILVLSAKDNNRKAIVQVEIKKSLKPEGRRE